MNQIANVEIIQIKLVKSLFLYNPAFTPPDGEMVSIGVLMENNGDFLEENKKAHFIQSFKTRADHDLPFNLEVDFAALFAFKAPVMPLEHPYYLKKILPLMVLPYMREYVAETTRRAGFPPLLINHNLFAGDDDTVIDPRLKSVADPTSWTH